MLLPKCTKTKETNLVNKNVPKPKETNVFAKIPETKGKPPTFNFQPSNNN